ncbi:MAG: heme lyase CcmF/NrfE family subunit [Geminicoccaceae bacterium]|nr:MAG: heme lyase CcmF/NrfE family subunit [Geminicoccaceae bacterium]
MIPELAHLALVIAFGVALVQSTLPLAGAARNDAGLIGLASSAAWAQFVLLTFSFGALVHLYMVSDFSILNVYQNSHDSKPMLYKITGTWGNHEGSLLLWVWVLTLFGAALAAFGKSMPATFKARVLAVQGMVTVAFIAFTLFTSNPFERLDPAPLEGTGLNPLLQDPGLAFHPPMLYIGYVGFSITFAFAVAALIEGRVDPSWARWIRPWVLIAWSSLTLGIALGSYWAYYELGWGGWWFWDPVENASFLPWLAGTALLHSIIVVEKRDSLKSWTILLAIFTFGFSLLGTFLVRSGVLTSVHAFAVDPDRGMFILLILAVALVGPLLLFAWRAPQMRASGAFQPISREGALIMNNLLLAAATGVVLLGTLYPLFLELVTGEKISVGPPFFNATFIPLMVPLLLILPIGTLLAWKRGDLRRSLRLMSLAAVAAIALALVAAFTDPRSTIVTALGFALAGWLFGGAVMDLLQRAGIGRSSWARLPARLVSLPGSAYAAAVAHTGVAVTVIGITASSAWQTEVITSMGYGDSQRVAGYNVTLAHVGPVQGPNWIANEGTFEVERDGRHIATLTSDRRHYPVEGTSTTEVGITSNLWRDVYVVIGEQTGDGLYVVRLYHNPLVVWIWLGTLLMAVAAVVSMADRRFRVGAPEPKRAKAAAAPAAPAPQAGS